MNPQFWLSDASIIRALRALGRFLPTVAVLMVLLAVPQLLKRQMAEAGFVAHHTPPESVVGPSAHDMGPATCHDANALCVTLELPASISATPEALVVSLEEEQSLSECSIPGQSLFRLERPSLAAGGTLEVVLDARVTGTYRLHAVIYMPGGGLDTGRPREGIDRVAISAPLVLTGEPLSVSEPVVFELSG